MKWGIAPRPAPPPLLLGFELPEKYRRSGQGGQAGRRRQEAREQDPPAEASPQRAALRPDAGGHAHRGYLRWH